MKKETVLGVDLGGTKILIGELDQEGNILESKVYPSKVASQVEALEQIKEVIGSYLENETLQGELIAISIDLVGRVDSEKGIWYEIHPENANEIPLADVISQQFKLPVVINNDVSSASLAEMNLGIGKKTKDFIYLNIGTGIAGRVIAAGQLLKGGHFNAGEIGHSLVGINNNVRCVCGRIDCVETFASGLGMSKEVHRLKKQFPSQLKITDHERVSGEEIINAFQKNDSLASQVVQQATKGVAELIMNLVRTSDPEAVVLGGGLINNDLFFKLVIEKLNANTMRFVTQGVRQTEIDPALIALKGCAVHAFQKRVAKEAK